MCENGPKSGGSGNYLNKCRAVPTLIFYYPILIAFPYIYSFCWYIGLISSNKYINKNSSAWDVATIEQKKYIGYKNINIFGTQ